MKRKYNKVTALLLSVLLSFSNISPVFAMEAAELPENAENLEKITEEMPLEEGEVPADEASDAEEVQDEFSESTELEVIEESLTETLEETQKTIQTGEAVTLEGDGPWIYYFTPEEDGEYYIEQIETDGWIYAEWYKVSNDEMLSDDSVQKLTANESYYIIVSDYAYPGDSFRIIKRIKNMIEIGETVKPEGSYLNWYYYFTPTESGNYTCEYSGSVDSIYWYEVTADGNLQGLGYDDVHDLATGKEYCLRIGTVHSESFCFRIVKNERHEIKPGDTIKLEDIYQGRYYFFTPEESGVYYLETDKELEDDYRGYVYAYWYEISGGRRIYLNGIQGKYALEAGTEYCFEIGSGYGDASVSLLRSEKLSPVKRLLPENSEKIGAGESRYFRLDLDPEKTYYLGVPLTWYDEDEGLLYCQYSEYWNSWNAVQHNGTAWLILESRYDKPTYLWVSSVPEDATICLTESPTFSENIEIWPASLSVPARGQKYLTLTGKTIPGDFLISLNAQTSGYTVSRKDFSSGEITIGNQDYFILSDKGLEGTVTFCIENSGDEDAVLSLKRETDFASSDIEAGRQYDSPSRYLSFTPANTGFYKIAQGQYDLQWIYKKSDKSAVRYASGDEYIYLEGGEEYLLCWSGSVFSITEEKPDIIETSGKALEMEADTYYAFTPAETGVYVADPNPRRVTCWCGCEEGEWKRDKDTGHYGHYMEAGKIYYIRPVYDDVRISLKRNITILDYDYYHAFIASGGAVSVDAAGTLTITEGSAGWSLKSAVCSLFDFIRGGIADLSKFAGGNQYWKTENEGGFKADKIYDLKDPTTQIQQPDHIKDKDVLLVEYRPEIVWVQSITLEPGQASLEAGASVQIKATVDKGQDKYDFTAEPVLRWESSDAAVASVDEKGKVTANKPGKATITVYADEALRKQEGLSDIVKASIEISVAGDPGEPAIQVIHLEQSVVLGDEPWTYEFTPTEDGVYYLSSDQSDMTADWRAASDNKEPESVQGKYTLKANEKYLISIKTGTKGSSFKILKEVKEPEKITYAITFNLQGKGTALPEYAGYTGIEKGSTVKKPADPEADGYAFTGWYKEASCQNLWDFEKDTVETDVTLYAGWVSESDYEGVLPGDAPVAGSRDGFWVAAIEDQTYTGKAIKPAVHVYSQDRRLKEGWDYTLTYKNNVKVSASKTPQIIVKGKGNYTGTYKVSFKIVKAGLNESHLVYVSSYPQGKAYTPFMIKDGILLKANTDYTITYENNETHVVTKKAPVKMGSYTVHVKGKGSCEGGCDVSLTVTDKDETTGITKAKASIRAMTYRGDTPKPTLRIKGNDLKEGTDYTVLYVNTNAKGTATAIFTGQGAYSGILKKTFKVKAASIASIPYEDITVSESAVYKKGGAKPDITVTMDGVKLTMGVDYTVSYKNNKKVGRKATVTITGKGNYSGKVRREFQVVAE